MKICVYILCLCLCWLTFWDYFLSIANTHRLVGISSISSWHHSALWCVDSSYHIWFCQITAFLRQTANSSLVWYRIVRPSVDTCWERGPSQPTRRPAARESNQFSCQWWSQRAEAFDSCSHGTQRQPDVWEISRFPRLVEHSETRQLCLSDSSTPTHCHWSARFSRWHSESRVAPPQSRCGRSAVARKSADARPSCFSHRHIAAHWWTRTRHEKGRNCRIWMSSPSIVDAARQSSFLGQPLESIQWDTSQYRRALSPHYSLSCRSFHSTVWHDDVPMLESSSDYNE